MCHVQAYVKQILGAASSGDGGSASRAATARVAVRCICGLLTALPHFNHASDLLQAAVAAMASR
jgi:nucleolar complex protein 3